MRFQCSHDAAGRTVGLSEHFLRLCRSSATSCIDTFAAIFDHLVLTVAMRVRVTVQFGRICYPL